MAEVVYCYTRAQAIADGVLVDVTPLAHEIGFHIPVALTRIVWQKCVVVPEEVRYQDETRRLQDLLVCLGITVRQANERASQVTMDVSVRNKPDSFEELSLLAVCGPGDNGEPVLTVMFPDED